MPVGSPGFSLNPDFFSRGCVHYKCSETITMLMLIGHNSDGIKNVDRTTFCNSLFKKKSSRFPNRIVIANSCKMTSDSQDIMLNLFVFIL